MKERPILFKGEMVRAILDGRKTQTRRIVKPKRSAEGLLWRPDGRYALPSELMESLEIQGFDVVDDGRPIHRVTPPCPYGRLGDRLWVRETARPSTTNDFSTIEYKADEVHIPIRDTAESAELWIAWRRPEEQYPELEPPKWRPSIHMPRWTSRITLEITEVRVERLQAITEEDAKAEGAPAAPILEEDQPTSCHIEGFAQLWESINGEGSWDQNPWVWVVEFKPLPPCEEA